MHYSKLLNLMYFADGYLCYKNYGTTVGESLVDSRCSVCHKQSFDVKDSQQLTGGLGKMAQHYSVWLAFGIIISSIPSQLLGCLK